MATAVTSNPFGGPPQSEEAAANPFATPKSLEPASAAKSRPTHARSASNPFATASPSQQRSRKFEFEAVAPRAEVVQPDRPGGYGGQAPSRSYDVNAVNPFEKPAVAKSDAP